MFRLFISLNSFKLNKPALCKPHLLFAPLRTSCGSRFHPARPNITTVIPPPSPARSLRMSARSLPVLCPRTLAPLASYAAAALQRGYTGLMLAAESGHEAVVRLLLEHKAEVDAADEVP